MPASSLRCKTVGSVSGSHGLPARQRLSDAQFEAIMGELSKIKQMLRQILHG